MLEFLRAQVAAVLGHASPEAIAPSALSRNWASTRSPQSSYATA